VPDWHRRGSTFQWWADPYSQTSPAGRTTSGKTQIWLTNSHENNCKHAQWLWCNIVIISSKGGVLGEGAVSPFPPAIGLGECWVLPSGVWGKAPAQNWYPLSSPVISFENNRSVYVCQISYWNFWGVQTPKTPPFTALILHQKWKTNEDKILIYPVICPFPIFVALCDHKKHQHYRQTDRQTDKHHACSISSTCVYSAHHAAKENENICTQITSNTRTHTHTHSRSP